MQPKSQRRYTKRRTDLSLIFCAGIVIYTVGWRSESAIAEAVISFAFLTGMALLGIYQGVGHADLRAISKQKDPDQ